MHATPLRKTLSSVVGWLADRRIPRALRAPLFGTYARFYDVDLGEVRLPLEEHPSLAQFFVRRLRDGARPFPAEAEVLPAPCDGRLQACDPIRSGSVLQAKGRAYPVREILAGLGDDVDLEGGHAWTIYLSPRDYHRVHTPLTGGLSAVRWTDGARYSVAPKVLAAREKVLSVNERAVLRLDGGHGPLFLVMVGALNVGRIRVVGIEAQRDGWNAQRDGRNARHSGVLTPPKELARGDELARFEMGSTVVLIAPPKSYVPAAELSLGQAIRMGQVIGRM